MPNNSKPEHLKVISGTSRADRKPEPGAADIPAIDEMPQMPAWLTSQHGQDEWRRLGPILLRHRLLTEANVNAFASLCALHGAIVQFYAAGTVPSNGMLGQHRALLMQFGLTPASASKARAHGGGGGESANPFGRNGRRAA